MKQTRSLVRIDGADYELLNPGELSRSDSRELAEIGRRLDVLMLDQGSEEQAAAVTAAIDTFCRRVLRAPAEVHARLSDTQRLEITQAFTNLLRGVHE